MCISRSVGKGVRNNSRTDVKTIQILININIGKIIPYSPLEVDGLIGNATYAAIGEFQSRVVKMTKPDQRVDPNGTTLKKLREGIPNTLTTDVLQGVMPNATTNNLSLYYPHLLTKMKDRKINTPLRQAHFLAQIAHESGSLRYSKEIASGEAYEGRADLGNTESGDGKRFKGRGLIQLTGRANYKKYGDNIGIKLTENNNWETVATSAERAVDVACWFWNIKGLNALADKDDLRKITRRINGRYNGFEDRRKYLIRAKFFLGVD